MAIEVTITIDDTDVITEVEQRVLNALSSKYPFTGVEIRAEGTPVSGNTSGGHLHFEAKEAPAKEAPAKEAPAKEAPAKEAPAKEAPAKDDDLIKAAVDKATELVNAGKTSDVKAALNAVGAKRVSELKGKAIQEFLDEIGE